ncbi:Uncharacterised protein [Mycobacteroides abscessus]|nr:Uncharacterised protein [Mycobacteroides abscessus]CPU63270.1 Uncharacterised protein [Mycobacteroides abscessus]SKK67828.1 Uncharacterised protein [Mycobacteroides abscessus subsp. massiliense]SKQ42646.1 putative two-component histidine kinase [Mycobacteroides abscessus subsp. massiliense]
MSSGGVGRWDRQKLDIGHRAAGSWAVLDLRRSWGLKRETSLQISAQLAAVKMTGDALGAAWALRNLAKMRPGMPLRKSPSGCVLRPATHICRCARTVRVSRSPSGIGCLSVLSGWMPIVPDAAVGAGWVWRSSLKSLPPMGAPWSLGTPSVVGRRSPFNCGWSTHPNQAGSPHHGRLRSGGRRSCGADARHRLRLRCRGRRSWLSPNIFQDIGFRDRGTFVAQQIFQQAVFRSTTSRVGSSEIS